MATVVAMAIATTTAEAATGWSSPFRASSGSIASSATVAAAPSGAVALWVGANDVLRARRIARDGSQGPIRALGRSDGGPWVAVDRRNVATVVWFDRSDYSLMARRLNGQSRPGPALRVAAPDMTGGYPFRDARVAVDADGDATVVWPRIVGTGWKGLDIGEATAHARRLPAKGRPGPVLDVPAGGEFDTAPRVAVTPSGRATVAWVRTSAGRAAVVATTIDSRGAIGAIQPVSDPALPPSLEYASQGLELALDRAGHATFAWRAGGAAGVSLAARRRSTGGLLGPQWTVASGDVGASGIRTVVDRDGRATILWLRHGDDYSIEARRLTADRMGPTQTIVTRNGYLPDAEAAVDRTGRVTVAWVSGSYDQRRVRSRSITPAGRLQRAQTVSRRGDLRGAQVVTTGPRDLLIAWSRPTRPGSFIEAARSVDRR